ncbi:MAG: glycosyltransferase [Rhodocyclaceae bacterium]|nr:glycosyltransferase [Rhodocyclaceae bacterium]
MSPVVSVLLPSYNHARYLRAAIDSVLAQSLDALELIVIDDASSDESWTIIESIDDPRVRASRHEENAGAHATLNEAYAKARGEFVAILNSDDVFAPERLQRIVDAMRADGAGFAFSTLRFVDDTGEPCPEHERAREYADACTWCSSKPATDWFLSGNLAVTTSNFVVRRSLAAELGRFRPLRYTHDWAWALDAAARAPLLWLRDEPLLDYRVHPTNTLSEDDHWRHIHENAFIQTLSIGRIDRIMQAQRDQRPIGEVICALLRNPSGPPAVTLAQVLRAQHGADEAELERDAAGSEGPWWAEQLAACTGQHRRVFASAGEISKLAMQMASQREMLEQRWQAMERMRFMIDERNAAIIAQKELIEARWQAVQALEGDVARREQTILDQTRLIDERDASIAAQGKMLEERFANMQKMGDEIHRRDLRIQSLEADIARIRNNPVVRLLLKIRQRLRGR